MSKEILPPEERMRAASATEMTGLMYTPPGDAEERRAYWEIQPMAGELPDIADPERERELRENEYRKKHRWD